MLVHLYFGFVGAELMDECFYVILLMIVNFVWINQFLPKESDDVDFSLPLRKSSCKTNTVGVSQKAD